MDNKDFVPYEPSLALKELGFDEPCFGKYLTSRLSDWKEYELDFEMGMNEEFEDNRNTYLLEGACSAPTFSQAFRWFRKKHNLFISIVHYDNGYSINDLRRFDTHEEAELACLRKLIEIIKKDK